MIAYRSDKIAAALLLVAWLPYCSLRCIDAGGGHGGCPLLPHEGSAASADAHHAHSGREQRRDVAHSRVNHGHGRGPDRHGEGDPAKTCCELTGKRNVLLSTADLQSASPPVVLGEALLSAPRSPVAVRPSGIAAKAHGPPIYLANATLAAVAPPRGASNVPRRKVLQVPGCPPASVPADHSMEVPHAWSISS